MPYKEPNVPSSYRRGKNHGKTFYDLVMELKPMIIVEFGTMCGYSTIAMAQALQDLKEGGRIYSFDIWDNRVHKDMAIKNLKDYGVADQVEMLELDFNEWMEKPTNFDLLYIDINNTGDTIARLKKAFPDKHVIFEGGIPERDEQVGWMMGKPKITDHEEDYEVINKSFPGLSKLKIK